MAGICYSPPLPPSLSPKIVSAIRCFSSSPEKFSGSRKNEASAIVKIAVSGVTELLRVFSSPISKRVDVVEDNLGEEFVVSGIDDVLNILKSDYENAYFVTGIFTSAIYANDCLFEDPTIRFRAWKLRTYLKLPWRPLVSIDGSTLYELDEDLKIVRHAESWSVSALEAIGQIFRPSFGGD